MSRITLHIGTQKTGTTALQTFLGENSEKLALQGFCFPTALAKHPGILKDRNAYFLTMLVANAVAPDRVSEEELELCRKNKDSFIELTRDAEHVILSDEMFWREGALRVGFWKELKRQLDEMGFDDVDFVVYLRRQDEFIASLWNQRVKSGVRLTTSCASYAKSDASRDLMDYAKVIAEIEDAFTSGCVRVRVYKRDELIGRDVRSDFCSVMGIDSSQGFTMEEEKPNLGMSNNITEIKRVANRNESYRQTDNFLSTSAQQVSAQARIKDATSLLPPEIREEILQRYASGNEQIARTYLDREDGVLFGVPDQLPPAWDKDYDTYVRDVILLFTDALSTEHAKLVECQKRIAVLEKGRKKSTKRIVALEKTNERFMKRFDKVDSRVKAAEKRHETLEKKHTSLTKQVRGVKSRVEEIANRKTPMERLLHKGAGVLSRLGEKFGR